MVVLVDWNEHAVFKEFKPIESVKHTLFKGVDETIDFKWFVLPEGEKSRLVSFSIKPESKAMSYPKNLVLNKNKDTIFSLRLETNKLPDVWSGELLIKSEGLVKKVALEFEKTVSLH